MIQLPYLFIVLGVGLSVFHFPLRALSPKGSARRMKLKHLASRVEILGIALLATGILAAAVGEVIR